MALRRFSSRSLTGGKLRRPIFSFSTMPPSRPPASGLQGMTPMPYCSQAGRTSSSTVRAMRLYKLCSLTRPRKFRFDAASLARAMCQPAKLLLPT